MSDERCRPVVTNPFATRFVAPGQLGWIPPSPLLGLKQLQTKLHDLNYRAAVVGPHGSGKSTLLEHLLKPLGTPAIKCDHSGSPVVKSEHGRLIWLTLRRGSHRGFSRFHWRPGRILVLDGFEQLSLVVRTWITLETRARKMGLLVTSHRSTALTTLVQTAVSIETLRAVLHETLQASGGWATFELQCDDDRLGDLIAKHHGNVREIMMQLYDEFEARSVPDKSI